MAEKKIGNCKVCSEEKQICSESEICFNCFLADEIEEPEEEESIGECISCNDFPVLIFMNQCFECMDIEFENGIHQLEID